MGDKTIKIIKNSYFYLFIIILVQILILIYYINIKTVPYYDEIWTYGLANSKDKPFLYDLYSTFGENDGADLLYNRWVNGDYYFKYITVQPSERFDFKNVYENQTSDLHPPLYYYLLHFVCSFFPNSFSLWYGYSINIFFLILTQIILFKLNFLIFKKKSLSLIICTFFGLGMGAVNEFIYIRMYAILSFFYLSITYLALDIICRGTITKKDLIKVIIISFLGFLAENQFYYYVFALTLSSFVFLLFKKNYRLMFEYIVSGLLGLLLFWNYFPWIFIQSQRFDSSTWKVSNFLLKPFPLKEVFGNLSIINNYIWGLDTGYQLNVFKYVSIYIYNFMNYIPVWVTLILLLVLFYSILKKEKYNFKWLIFLFTFVIYHILLASNTFYSRTLFFFGLYTFSILPCFAIVFLYLYKCIIYNFIKNKKISIFLFFIGIVTFIIASHYNSDRLWCCDLKPGTAKICDFLNNKSVIYIVDSNVLVDPIIHAKPWNFMKAKRVFVSRSHNVDKILKAISLLPTNDECILFIPNSHRGENLYNQLIKLKNVVNLSFIGIDNVQVCSFYMFILKT